MLYSHLNCEVSLAPAFDLNFYQDRGEDRMEGAHVFRRRIPCKRSKIVENQPFLEKKCQTLYVSGAGYTEQSLQLLCGAIAYQVPFRSR